MRQVGNQLLKNLYIKNDILNGQFRVDQLEVGTVGIQAVVNSYDLDGWQTHFSGGQVTNISRDAGSSEGKLARIATVTASDGIVNADDYDVQYTRIEGYDCVKYIGRTFTLAFRVRSAIAGIHCIAIYDGTSSLIKEYIIDVADTWQDVSIIIEGGLQTVESTTNYAGVYVHWATMCGLNHQTTADTWTAGGSIFGTSNQVNVMGAVGNEFALEDVTLNLGGKATEDVATYGQDLARCQRYYAALKGANSPYLLDGYNIASGYMTNVHTLPVEMRAIPSISFTSGATSNLSENLLIGNDTLTFTHRIRVVAQGNGYGYMANVRARARL